MSQNKPFGAFLLVAAGTGINAARGLQKGHNPFPTLLAGIAFGAICVALNDLNSARLGTMFAALFLFGSVLTNGVAIIDSVNVALKSYEKEG